MSNNNNTQEELITLQYSVKPTKTQEQTLKSHAGAVRYAYNWTLNHIQTHLKKP